MKGTAPRHTTLEGGVDRKTLKRTKERFLEINQGRLERARESLATRQQLVLDLLPLLFAVNHPLLPGFVSRNCPVGLSNYTPDQQALKEAMRIARSFKYQRKTTTDSDIYSIYLMGSCGSLAHSDHSDLDIWICHDPKLNAKQLKELQLKCDGIIAWAESLNLEIYFFLMDDVKFRNLQHQVELNGEDCGSSQHFLLLDEFYRTAVLVAGRYPIWWLIPPDNEIDYDHYANLLRDKRFIREGETIDFGGLATIPRQEFLGAAMWQMFKGLESPYKSVLKLMLTEYYASCDKPVTLALRYKLAVYTQKLNIDELDPYTMLYRQLEEYLCAQQQTERLELIRRAFYFKVGKKLSVKTRSRSGWKAKALSALCKEWQWSASHLSSLDQRAQWKVERVGEERALLVDQLMYSYRYLIQIAQEDSELKASISERDMKLLGRRLYAAFERRANKVENINPNVSADMSEANISLAPHPRMPQQWQLFRGALKREQLSHAPALKQSGSLVKLLTWCHVNRIVDRGSSLSLHPGQSDLREPELQSITSCLQALMPQKQTKPSDKAMLRPSKTKSMLLLINVGLDPMAATSKKDQHLISSQTDALGYSSTRTNLVLSIDQVAVNSWNEWSTTRYEGSEALSECIQDFLSLNEQLEEDESVRLKVRCFCKNRSSQIEERLKVLFSDIQTRFCHPAQAQQARYVLQVEKRFYVLHREHGPAKISALASESALVQFLGKPQKHYSPIVLDKHALEKSELRLILSEVKAREVQVFYRLERHTAHLYIIDERGSLFYQRMLFLDAQAMLAHIDDFLQRILFRLNAQFERPMLSTQISFYQLFLRSEFKPAHIEKLAAPSFTANPSYFDVQVIVQKSSHGNEGLSIFCGLDEYSHDSCGDHLFSEVAQHILQRRHNNERYPCYITDLDLSALNLGDSTQLCHFLQRKRDIELELNKALQI